MTEGGRLAGRVALVTGGGRGLGRAIAERYGREGARVAIAEIDGDLAREAAAALGEGGLGIQCDVANAADVERAFDCLPRALRAPGRPRQQRGRRRACRQALPRNRRADLGPRARREPQGALPVHGACGAPHGRAGRRRDHQHLERRREPGAPRDGRLRRRQGRGRGLHARRRARSGALRRALRVHRARPDGDLRLRARQPKSARRRPRRPCRSAARAPAPTSRARRCSSRARMRAISPDRASTSTAAC